MLFGSINIIQAFLYLIGIILLALLFKAINIEKKYNEKKLEKII